MLVSLALTATAAQAAAPGPAADGERRLGHLPYADVGVAALVSAPAGFAVGQPCQVQPAVAAALGELMAAQAASGVAGTVRGVSCYRSVAHQRSVFCHGRSCVETEGRAHMVAPPGYSEHETGYAVDFAARPSLGCADTRDCIAATPVGQWLLANAPRFGFELSFPAGNAQGVGWEPWHWRWVGVDGEDSAARAAPYINAQPAAAVVNRDKFIETALDLIFSPLR
uniref:M15 family metallopeptidase n=1 Tax=Sphingomonas bacterium TaxID=1895847 RepID=UPI00157584AE